MNESVTSEPKRSRLNWRAIHHAYLYESPIPTYAQLAERFGGSHSSIAKRAADERWSEERIAREAEVEVRSTAEECERRAEALSVMKIESEQIIEQARTNHRTFQQIVAKINGLLLESLEKSDYALPDAFDIDAVVKANKADAEISARLHPSALPKEVTVNTGRTADVATVKAALLAEHPELAAIISQPAGTA